MSPERWQKIEEVFNHAADLKEAERSAFLEKECAGDLDLRSQVDELLRSVERSDQFIESPIWSDGLIDTSAKRDLIDSLELEEQDQTDETGRVIGSYRLKRELGRGGMGAVYLAERIDGEFEHTVAVKLIKRGMDSEFIIRRFRHERQILASFEHPFIARLIDGGTTGSGVPYFVMEYIEGDTLYHYSDRNELDINARLRLFVKICSALEYAHGKRIIHRDIKPGNIVVNKDGLPKLLDFGIAKVLDPDLIHESLNPTASMLRMMTPDYASPEQVKGIEVNQSSDIYSLGVLLYELLTGHRPHLFAGKPIHEISRIVCDELPMLPSRIFDTPSNILPMYASSPERIFEARRTDADQIRKQIKGNLDRIITRALHKDPKDRYASVADMSRDIVRHLDGASISASQPVSDSRIFTRPPENTRTLAVLPFRSLNIAPDQDTDELFLGVGLADALITRLSKVKRFVVRPTSSIRSFDKETIAPIKAGRELAVDYILDGNIKRAGGRLRVTVQLLNIKENAAIWATTIDEQVADVFTLEDKLANKVIEVLLPHLTRGEIREYSKSGTDSPEAFEHYLRGRYNFNIFTEDGLAQAFVGFHKAIAADPDYAHAYCGLADYYNWLGILGVLPPAECFPQAVAAAQRAVELDPNLSDGHASLGFALHAGSYNWAAAEHHLRKAIELNQSNANAFVWYSIVLFTEGRFAEGMDLARHAVEIDPLTPFNQHNVGWCLYFARRFDEARKAYLEVIENFPSYVFGYHGLSKVERFIGNHEKALEASRRTLETMDNGIFARLAHIECEASAGNIDTALDALAAIDVLRKERYISPTQLSWSYCYLTRSVPAAQADKYKDRVIELLREAVQMKDPWLNWAAVEPAFDCVRDRREFDDILEEIDYRHFFESSKFYVSSPDVSPNTTADNASHDATTLAGYDGAVTDPGEAPTRQLPAAGHLRILAFALILLLLAAGGFFAYRNLYLPAASPAAAPMTVEPTLVVLPFKSTEVLDDDLGAGLSDAISNRLGNVRSVKVLAASSGRAFAKTEEPNKWALDSGVAYLVQGDLKKQGDLITLEAEMIDTATKLPLWKETFSATDGDLFNVQRSITDKIINALHIKPQPLETQQLNKIYTYNANAYRMYLIGRYKMSIRTPQNLYAAIDAFSKSIGEDSNFALPYCALAEAYSVLNTYSTNAPADSYQQAEQMVNRALTIDPDLADAHAILGFIKFFHARDRVGSELEFRRAIQGNPSNAPARHWFALTLAASNRPAEALQEIEAAKSLDPRSPTIRSAAGVVAFQAGDLQRAIAESNKALEIDEGSVPAYKVLRWAYTVLRDKQAARQVLEKEMGYVGGSREHPGWQIIDAQLDALDENKQQVAERIDQIASNPIIRKSVAGFGFEIAIAYAAVDEPEKALTWLEMSEAAGAHSFNFLETDPRIKSLRSEPRYIALQKKLFR